MSETTRSEMLNEGRMTLWEHIAELRTRLMKSIGAVLAGGIVGWFLYPYVFTFLTNPLHSANKAAIIIAGSPIAPLLTRIKIAGYVGLILAMPVLVWQLWRFITPGLYPNEKRYAVPFTLGSVFFFVLGATVAYLSLLPTLAFLNAVGGSDIKQVYNIGDYLKLVVLMIIIFGVGFEFPVLLIALEIAGVVTPRQLSSVRRWAIVGIVVVSAVITPSSDPFSMLALAIPLYLFYELSIVFGWAYNKRKRRRAARAAMADGADT
jgi:sec-independent protein translocase protein TatC